MLHLIGKSHLRGESRLLEVGDAGEVDHRGWAAHQDDAVRGGREESVADHVVVNEPGAEAPA